jgi:hypothetical protein
MVLLLVMAAAAAAAAAMYDMDLTAGPTCYWHSTCMRGNSAAVDATHTASQLMLLWLLLLQGLLGQQSCSSASGALAALWQTTCHAAPAVRQLASLLVIQS